jgi:hypothetical protein
MLGPRIGRPIAYPIGKEAAVTPPQTATSVILKDARSSPKEASAFTGANFGSLTLSTRDIVGYDNDVYIIYETFLPRYKLFK